MNRSLVDGGPDQLHREEVPSRWCPRQHLGVDDPETKMNATDRRELHPGHPHTQRPQNQSLQAMRQLHRREEDRSRNEATTNRRGDPRRLSTTLHIITKIKKACRVANLRQVATKVKGHRVV
jgi:hypothetical protein